MAACCRTQSEHFFDPVIQAAVNLAEECADIPAIERALEIVHEYVPLSLWPPANPNSHELHFYQVLSGVEQLLDTIGLYRPDIQEYCSWQAALAHAAYIGLRHKPGETFTGGSGDAVEYCMNAVEWSYSMRNGIPVARQEFMGFDPPEAEAISTAISNLLRDIFGNPFRPVAFDPRWQTSTAVGLARTMYESRDFGAMPILADALQDAGCEDDAILNHCRDAKQVHVRGCWVVDLVLGKS